MTTAVHMERPTGEAAKHYEEALRLEREAASLVMHNNSPNEAERQKNFEEAQRLRGMFKAEWRKYEEASR